MNRSAISAPSAFLLRCLLRYFVTENLWTVVCV